MKTFNEFMSKADLQESMAIHAYSLGGGKFKVHKVGSKVNPDHVKVGDVVSSSDLDDLSDAGHKVKETKKPVKEEAEGIEEQSSTHDSHFQSVDKKTQSKINNQLRQGKDYPDAAKAAGAPVKEEVVSEKLTDDAKKLIQRGLGSRTPDNEMRKTSKSAREFIKLAKTKKENLK